MPIDVRQSKIDDAKTKLNNAYSSFTQARSDLAMVLPKDGDANNAILAELKDGINTSVTTTLNLVNLASTLT